MKFLYFIILFSSSIAADSIFDNCDDASVKTQLEEISISGDGYHLTELLFDSYCSSKKNEPNTLDALNELIEDLYLNSRIDESSQVLFFNWFLSLYPEILFNLQESAIVNNLVDTFLDHINEIEGEASRLEHQEYYAQTINIIAMYVRNHLQDPIISVELINYAERLLFNAAKEDYVLETDNLTILTHLKLNKISSLLISSNYDELLSEINLLTKLLSLQAHANEFESGLIIDLLMDLNGYDSRIKNSNSVLNLRITLFNSIISNKSLTFHEDFILQLLLYIFGESISNNNQFCNHDIFLNLVNDIRASHSLKDFINTLCFPTREKYFSKIDEIYNKYQKNSLYRKTFDRVAKSMIFPMNPDSDYSMLEAEQVVLDMSVIFSTGMSSNNSYRPFLDQVFDFCNTPDGKDYCSEMKRKVDFIKQSFLLNLPKEINIDNVENAGVVFFIAQDIYMSDLDSLEKFAKEFFLNHSIVFPNQEELLSYFNLYLASNELEIKNFSGIRQFSSLYNLASEWLFKTDNPDEDLYFANIYKQFSEFFMLSAETLYKLSSKNSFFDTLKSDLTRDTILQAIHSSVLSHLDYQYFSGDYDFIYFPSTAINLITKVKKNEFDHSVILEKYLRSDQNTYQNEDTYNLKRIIASNFRINNYLTLRKDISADEISYLRFEKDKNDRDTRKYLDNLSNFKKVQSDPSVIQIMQSLRDDEVLEYHFAIPMNLRRIVFRVSNDHIYVNSYHLHEDEINLIYKEFSEYKYVKKSRVRSDELSSIIFGSFSYQEEVNKIYLVSDSFLKFIPFHALKYKDKYLIENFTISYLPSIQAFLDLEKNIQPLNFLGIGHPDYATANETLFRTRGLKTMKDLSMLPETEGEIIDISKSFKSKKILLQGEATKENFLKNKNFHQNSMIYFATHNLPYGNSISDEPGLALTPDGLNSSGMLSISDISDNDFSGSIIALSACKTFDASFVDKEPYSGIAQSFFLGGASGVYTTMWEIESISASVFNKSLFNKYKNNLDLPISIQKTAMDFISGNAGETYKDPFFWAPYIYLGH